MKIGFLMATSLFLLIGSCKTQQEVGEKKDYEIVLSEGIYVEKFDSTNVSANRYTANNQTYRTGNKLVYDYFYEDREGKRYKFQENEGASKLDFRERVKAWSFVEMDSLTERTIDRVELTVKYGLEPMIDTDPEYNQTVIIYEYPQVNGEKQFNSSTGIIENEKNVWAHPPRDKLFRILEINPFPFIQAPYEIGNKWYWSLGIGSFWRDERWKTWEETIVNQYAYEIVDQQHIPLAIGETECYVVQANATSPIGQTHLTAYFNPDIGFVKLDYTNIDSSKLVLELIQFEPEEKVEEDMEEK